MTKITPKLLWLLLKIKFFEISSRALSKNIHEDGKLNIIIKIDKRLWFNRNWWRHRGSAKENSNWRKIIDYFGFCDTDWDDYILKKPRMLPIMEYFGEPIHTYSLKQGIEDGFCSYQREWPDGMIYRPETGVDANLDNYI